MHNICGGCGGSQCGRGGAGEVGCRDGGAEEACWCGGGSESTVFGNVDDGGSDEGWIAAEVGNPTDGGEG